MNRIFKTLLVFVGLAAMATAQKEAPKVGFLRIVNAISPGTGNASFIVDGKNLFPAGYSLGQTTGGFGLLAGTVNVEVKKEGVEKGSTKQPLEIGETITLIAFAEKVVPKKEDDPPKWEIKLLRLKQQEVQKGLGLSVVSVATPEEVPLKLSYMGSTKEEKIFAKRMTIAATTMKGGEVAIMSGERSLTVVSPDSRGNYVVVVFEDDKGELQALNFYDPKFVVAG